MQTNTAVAPNSQQKLQHWINKNQLNTKNKASSTKTFFRNPIKQKGKKHITDTIKVKPTIHESMRGKSKGEEVC